MSLMSWLFGGRPGRELQIAGDGHYDFGIVGESNYQSALDKICGGKCEDGVEHECVATLTPESSNPHDANAIKITIEGRTVGYLSRSDALKFHREMKRLSIRGQSVKCDAIVVGGWDRGDNDQGHFGVKLDMAWPVKI
jgi:hypothetical protein